MDGLVQGKYCFGNSNGTVLYQDRLGTGERLNPELFINNKKDTLNASMITRYYQTQCFSSGVDTIAIILFYAPTAVDSLHEIVASLGSLKPASTTEFKLYPAVLHSLQLEYTQQRAVPDTVFLTEPVLLNAIGYDRFGNRRGLTASTWSVNNTLHPLSSVTKTSQIYYEINKVKDDESGFIKATARESIADSVFVFIKGPLPLLTSAITHDYNGNGYLDRIELHFNKVITLPPDYYFKNLQITHNAVNFTIDSILDNNGRTDSIWVIVLKEFETKKTPQTSWTPTLSFDTDTAHGFSGANVIAIDGAGPVVWYVEKKVIDLNDRKKDAVYVHMSEPVLRAVDRNSLRNIDIPSDIFSVWEKGPFQTDKYYPLNIFDNIPYCIDIIKDSLIIFKTTNGKDLTARHFVNINIDKMFITDKTDRSNQPVIDNQKVPVVVRGLPTKKVIPFPNPSVSTFRRVKPGVFNAVHEPQARKWVFADNAGTILTFNLLIPENGIKVSCNTIIYDAIGNRVIDTYNDDLTSSLPPNVQNNQSTSYDVDIYWNGSNAEGMRVAPGVYKVIIYLEYTGQGAEKYERSRMSCFAGIRR
jgi:hypothetical protein